MNILLKLILPILCAFIVFAGTVHFYWAPKVYEQARQDFELQAKREFSAMEDDLVRSILANDFSALFTSLDKQIKKNHHRWINLNLFDKFNKQLYPVIPDTIQETHHFHILLNYPLKSDGIHVGYINVHLNWQEKFNETQGRINELELFLLATVIILFVVVLLIQIKFIRMPLARLQEFAVNMAQGDTDKELVILNNDEFGQLSRAFNTMQKNIIASKHALLELKYALDQHAIVSITDVYGVITSVNDHFCDLSGYSRTELIGKDHRILNSGHHDSEFFAEMYDTLKQGNVWHNEICNRAKDGQLYWVNATIVPIKDNSGKLKNYIAIRTDISSRKKVEEELIQAKDDAEVASQTKGEFLANMSHEIRTPLNAILGFISLLREKEQDAESSKFLKIINDSGNSLLGIISDILDFSKIESGKLEISPITFNPTLELESTADLFKARSSEKKITLEVLLDKHLPVSIQTDIYRLKQIISNLLSNAIKFTKEYKKIIFKVDYSNGLLNCSIEDEGIGLTPEAQVHIFDSFTQAESSTTRKYGGTGLGLAISSKLVELLGGKLKVKSELGRGSLFYFSIPVKIVEAVMEDKIQKTPSSLSVKGDILLVEDNKVNQMLMSAILKKLGLSFEIAKDGLEAVSAFQSKSYDLILMDENMPNLNGIAATKQIRLLEQKEGKTPTPIVALTANAMNGDRERFLQSGMDEYLTKPVNKIKLLEVLSHFLTLDH